jgi:thiosulfate reductase/polysulfide reductase chain A
MRKLTFDRRGFLKLAGVSTVAFGAATTGLPSPLQATEKEKATRGARFLHYDRGVETHSFCEMCFWNCGVNVYTRNGKIHKLEGNPLHPNNRGHLCAKGNAGILSTYDPDRIKGPLIRTGKRGEGAFKQVSWKEAFDEVHKRLAPLLEKHGGETLATFMHGTGERYVHTLTWALESPNITVPAYSQCMGSREMAWVLTFGIGVSGHETYDMAHTKHMILFGRNMAGAIQVREAEDFAEGLARGARLTYVDPRLSESAARATDWLQIRPGTDGALALGLIHVIIRDRLYDAEFLAKYAHGFKELQAHIKQYTPEWAEQRCGIDAKTIERIAWEFAKEAPNVVAIPPRRMTRYGNDTQTVRAIAILNALMGNWGVPGGIFVRSAVPLELPEQEHPDEPDVRRADGVGKGERFALAPPSLGRTNGIIEATRTQKPYPIKAWLLYGTNPLSHSSIGENKIFDAIDNLDLIIAIDTQYSDTVMYADIVLPESTYLERDDAPYIQKDKTPFIALRKAAIKPIYDTKGAYEICKGIAERFEVDDWFEHSPKQQMEELMRVLNEAQRKELEEKGVVLFEEADPYPVASGAKPVFMTATGKIQLYADELVELHKQHGEDFNPLPVYKDPPQPAEGEFRLLFGRTPHHSHARSQNNPILMELQDDSPIWIHPDDAKKLGLKAGDKVTIQSKATGYTSLPEHVKITRRIQAGSIFVNHGFGHRTSRWHLGNLKGIKDNYFVSDGVDPISGAAAFHNGFVTIKKVQS